MTVPTTSTTLLRDIGSSADNARWGEFVERYQGMMAAYLKANFPSLEAEDIVQETLMTLSGILPNYQYDPEAKGYFHNYLTGILRNKARRECEKRARDKASRDAAAAAFAAGSDAAHDARIAEWQKSVYEIAMRELLSDDSIHQRSKQIFLRLSVDGMSPTEVASAYGVERNAVDKIKSRMIARLREIVASLEGADGIV
jgi:RNA polymerase sigma factor (sigma-70 family)